MLDAVVQTAQPLDQNGGQAMDPPGDPAQAVGPVVDAIHAGHDRQQGLRGADIAGRFFAADMLLAGLQGQAQGRRAMAVDRDPHQAPGHGPLMGLAGREKGRVRAAETKRHAETLG